MPAALQCYNSAGTLQIDTQYMNMVCVDKGYITIGQTSGMPAGYGSGIQTLGGRYSNPIFAWAVVNSNYAGSAIIDDITLSGTLTPQTGGAPSGSTNSLTFTLGVHVSGLSGTMKVAYYVFDRMPNTASSFGLTTWNQNGVVTFSSDYEPLRIINITQIENGNLSSPTPYSISGTYSGQKLAAAFTNPKSYINADPYVSSSNGREYIQDIYISNPSGGVPSISTSTYIPGYSTDGSLIGSVQSVGGQLMAIDVTNIWLP